MQKNLSQFVTLASNLTSTFQRAVNDFNQPDWADLLTLLDDNVVVAGVDDPVNNTFSGINDVITFLQDSGGRFHPTYQLTQSYDSQGYVIGVADWIDSDDAPNKQDGPILFSFIFVNRGTAATPDWRIIRLWGSRPFGETESVTQ